MVPGSCCLPLDPNKVSHNLVALRKRADAGSEPTPALGPSPTERQRTMATTVPQTASARRADVPDLLAQLVDILRDCAQESARLSAAPQARQ